MLLVFNIGNADITFGVWDMDPVLGDRLRFEASIAAFPARTADEYTVLLGQIFSLRGMDPNELRASVTDVMISSVVPALLDPIRTAIAGLTPVRPTVVGPGVRTGMEIRIDSPTQLGADLVAIAAGTKNRVGGPAVAVSFEAAITLTVLDKNAAVCGVVILPGIGSSAAALARDAALLPQTSLTPPRHVIGRNTVDSIRAGLFWGTAAQIDGLCARIAEELGLMPDALPVLATGSHAAAVMPLCRRSCEICPHLLFEGLLALHRANHRT